MNININEKKYKVITEKVNDKDYNIKVMIKKRNCKLCNKVIEVAENDLFSWIDDKHYLRIGYFCKKDEVLIKKVLKIERA